MKGLKMDNNIKNLEISISLVDGGLMIYSELFTSGKELINTLISDDWGAPPLLLTITSKTDDGKTVTISIPYKDGLTKTSARIIESE